MMQARQERGARSTEATTRRHALLDVLAEGIWTLLTADPEDDEGALNPLNQRCFRHAPTAPCVSERGPVNAPPDSGGQA
jgi:hypothetical protein